MDTYSKLRGLWNILPSGSNPDVENRIWLSISGMIRSQRNRRRAILATSVSVAIAACLALGVFIGLNIDSDIIEIRNRTILSADLRQTLPDGSEVWMEKGSTLTFSDDFSTRREVWLDGDAGFEVIHADDSTPFYVHLTNSVIKVMGTGFTVRQNEESVAVALHHGKVEVCLGGKGIPVVVKPKQECIYDLSTGQHRLVDFFRSVTWHDGVYDIQNADLNELSDFIKWRYGVTVSYGDMAGNVQKINGLIAHDEPIESVLDKICYVLKTECKRCDDIFVISKK